MVGEALAVGVADAISPLVQWGKPHWTAAAFSRQLRRETGVRRFGGVSSDRANEPTGEV